MLNGRNVNKAHANGREGPTANACSACEAMQKLILTVTTLSDIPLLPFLASGVPFLAMNSEGSYRHKNGPPLSKSKACDYKKSLGRLYACLRVEIMN